MQTSSLVLPAAHEERLSSGSHTPPCEFERDSVQMKRTSEAAGQKFLKVL